MAERNHQEFYTVPEVPSLDRLCGVGSVALASLRTEHSRSLEDAERLKSVNMLINLGVLTRLLDMELYHGRAARPGERWRIDPEFTNGGNDSGNWNINMRPTLYTGTQDVACRFAKKRVLRRPSSKAEVHKVASLDMDAVVLRWLDSDFSAAEMRQYHDAMITLAPNIIKHAEFPFGTSQSDIESALREVQDILGGAKVRLISDDECLGMSELARRLVARCNTKMFVVESPYWLHTVVNKYLEAEHTIKDKDSGRLYQIDHSFIVQLAQSMHLVGSEQPIYSGTLNEDVLIVSFFDLYSVDSEHGAQHDRQRIDDIFSEFSQTVGDQLGSIKDPLRSVIMNPHTTPEAIMEVVGNISDGYWGQVFSEDAGNWEKYTLGEHTETVLRNLENNFANDLPVGALAFARLALIVHDIGKSKAAAVRRKHIQSVYNKQYSQKFLQEVGVGEEFGQFIVHMIIDGMELAERYLVSKEPDAREELRRLADRQISASFVDMYNGIEAYWLIAYILQTCDGGAYTKRARTRRAIGIDGADVLIQNAGSFDNSFRKLPNDMTGQRLEWEL